MKLDIQEAKKILDKIQVASYNDPTKPEFPFEDPKFPATPTYQIQVPWFSNVWLKDESYNPTWTHKDRMAWEIIVSYKDILKTAQKSTSWKIDLPHMSLISSGSAALAIQTALQHFHLPHLKVLMDHGTNPWIMESLEALWAEVYLTDLSKQILKSTDILQQTHNVQGIDITSADALDPNTRFYDWLSYEIINTDPQRCFVPFGTGVLYENLLSVAKKELSEHRESDPRFTGNKNIIKSCHYIWWTTNNPNSQATKLYSPYLPFSHFDEQWLKIYKYAWYCGEYSNVYIIRENLLEQALQILRSQGVSIEPSAAAWLALLLQMKKQIPSDDKILIVSTGNTKWK